MQETKQKKNTATEELLGGLYKNAKMGADSVVDLLSKVQKTDLKSAMTLQMDGYEQYATRAKEMLNAQGEGDRAKEENIFTISSGISCVGSPTACVAGPISFPNNSKNPEDRRIPTAIISPTSVGRISTTMRSPSLAPFKKVS